MSNLQIPPVILQDLARDLLCAMRCPGNNAGKIAASLLQSDIRGIDTHGVALLPMYARMISDGALDPLADITITRKTDCIISVDGHDGFGQLAGNQATEAGIEAAQRSGLATVAIHNAGHLGRLGEWATLAAEAGLVFSAFCNTGGGAINVAAFGGHERKLSTNPIAFAVPAFDALPFDIIIDFATSQVSGARIQQYARKNIPLEEDWTTGRDDRPVMDGQSFMQGQGALLPLGGRLTGHKGYALALVAELYGGIAGGMVAGQHQPLWFTNAALFSFLDPLQFISVNDLEARIESLVAHLQDDKVRIPGQQSHENMLLTEKQGVSVQPHVLSSLAKTAGQLNVKIGDEISSVLAEFENAD